MTDMIERVAKAIYEQRNGRGAMPWSRRDAAHKAPYLSDARAAIEAMQGWQPIETAPRDGTWVLIFGGGRQFVATWDDAVKLWSPSAGVWAGPASHWRTLPSPPALGETG